MFQRIDNIHSFQYTVSYQNNGLLARADVAASLLTDGLSAINDVLERTGIHRLHQVDTTVRDATSGDVARRDVPLMQFALQDDLFGFSIAVLDNRIVWSRSDSSLEAFYTWYSALMPEVNALESTFRRIVSNTTGDDLRVVSTVYDFGFYFTEFRTIPSPSRASPPPRAERRRNLDALQKLIGNLPDETGEMREMSKQSFLRLDLTLSRIERFAAADHDKYRNTWYFLEAPSNEGGNYLIFRAQMRNTSQEIPDAGEQLAPTVIPFDPDYADDYQIALFEFLKKRAMQGFAAKLFDTLDFNTARDF